MHKIIIRSSLSSTRIQKYALPFRSFVGHLVLNCYGISSRDNNSEKGCQSLGPPRAPPAAERPNGTVTSIWVPSIHRSLVISLAAVREHDRKFRWPPLSPSRLFLCFELVVGLPIPLSYWFAFHLVDGNPFASDIHIPWFLAPNRQ